MLQVEELRVRYGQRMAVSGLSFSLQAGEWLMLVGPNGAGKSTAVKALAQQVPYSGRILLGGRDAAGMRPGERARFMGVLAQHYSPQYAYTVGEIVELGRYARRAGLLGRGAPEDRSAVEEALALTGMTEYRDTSVLALSGGELQRAFLAQVFAQRPRLLILDEPANHLDLLYQQRIFDLIAAWLREPGRAVLSVVHDLSLARRYGSRVLLMDGGRQAALGSADEVLAPELLRRVYGMDVAAWMRDLLAAWQ